MTEIKFYADKSRLYGFLVSGHSSFDCDDEEGKILCSAISSACYMTANTISEIIGDKVLADVDDGFMEIRVENPSEKTEAVLLGFKLHMEQLCLQFSDRISILSEV
jgi:uncharacterized protein YsxB (DUF464 family)